MLTKKAKSQKRWVAFIKNLNESFLEISVPQPQSKFLPSRGGGEEGGRERNVLRTLLGCLEKGGIFSSYVGGL